MVTLIVFALEIVAVSIMHSNPISLIPPVTAEPPVSDL